MYGEKNAAQNWQLSFLYIRFKMRNLFYNPTTHSSS